MSSQQQQQQLNEENASVEMAYLLLDDCYFGFRLQQQSPGADNHHHNNTSVKAPIVPPPTFHQWIPVQIVPSNEIEVSPTASYERRHLIVTQNDSGELVVDRNVVAHYDGTIRDRTGRTDAALLMGLCAACHPHVQTVHCEILLWSPSSSSSSSPHSNTEAEDEDCYYGALALTLSFPNLSRSRTVHVVNDQKHHRTRSTRRRIVANGTNTTSTKISPTKPLHPALQLLFTLIRSDWDQYEIRKQRLLMISRNNSITPKPFVSFFPSSLTLSSMYERMHQPPTFDMNNHNGAASSDTTLSHCTLTSLPLDILKRNIVHPYFDASTLASLRATCRTMHDSLRAMVPGLKLPLYHHQVNSLHWMRQRETSLIRTESDCFDDSRTTGVLQNNETGDIHRAITGGASVKLCTKAPLTPPSPNEREVIYLDPYTGVEIFPDDICQRKELRRHVACGGLLCDDPGLGKTITVLALILQTARPTKYRRTVTSHPPTPEPSVNDSRNHISEDENTILSPLSTQGPCVNDPNNQFNDDELFELYWSEEISREFREQYLLRLVNDFCKKIPLANASLFPISDFRRSIGKDGYGTSFAQFDTDVKTVIRNCEASEDPEALSSLMPTWQILVHDLKRLQLNSVRKFFANAKAKPNSRIAALVQEESRRKHLNSLLSSPGTLIVVPSVLLEHWKAQINQHVDFSYLTEKIPLIFEFKRGESSLTYKSATVLCCTNQTHAPMVFIDNGGTLPLPPAEFLAMFQIVITTTQRFVNGAKHGSFQDELERDNQIRRPLTEYFDNDDDSECCELLKVHWMRMVVDEGHSMGNNEHNSSITFASWIKAYRRWAMTGTPTKQTATQLRQVKGLLSFLQHEFFNSRLNGDLLWKSRIGKGWKDGEMASFFRLNNLLRFLMRRHTKLNIEELPPPLYIKSKVETSCVEANTYNTLVSTVQMNLLLTSMNGKTSGFQDSLLHRSQAKNARLALQNIRRVCTGWSRVVPTLSFRYYAETVEMANSFNHSDDAIAKIKLFMTRAEQEELSTCSCCGIQVSTMLLMSCCGGLICTECMDSSTNICYLCENQFDVDELQKFQPGFVLDWRSNVESAHSTKEISNTASPPVSSIEPLIRPIQARQRSKKPGDGHKCDYDFYAIDGRCIYCLEEHQFCCLHNDQWRCNVCYRTAEDCPMDESKSYFLSRRLMELHNQHSKGYARPNDAAYFWNAFRPLKVIIFSQFRNALNFIGDRLLRKFGTACVAEFFGIHRKQELYKFTHDECCFCLLLTKDGSEGLDLSFVTNIIFLEEVFDKSLMDQVVARAWRMGACGRVTIETLIAKNTIEEIIGEQPGSRTAGFQQDTPSINGDQQRLKSLLQSLQFIIDHQSPFRHNSLSIKHDTETNGSEIDGNSLKRSIVKTNSDESVCRPYKRGRTVRFADID